MHITLTAHRTYILPLAGFVAQLEPLPPDWQQVERKIMVTLFPGSRGWVDLLLVHHLRDLGHTIEMKDAVAMAQGAKCRVYRWGNFENGGAANPQEKQAARDYRQEHGALWLMAPLGRQQLFFGTSSGLSCSWRTRPRRKD